MSWSVSLRFAKDVKTDEWKTRDVCDKWWKGEGWEFFFKKLDHYTQNIQRKVSVYHNHSSHKIIFNWLKITSHSLYIVIGLPRVLYNNWGFFSTFSPHTLGLLVYFISFSNFSAILWLPNLMGKVKPERYTSNELTVETPNHGKVTVNLNILGGYQGAKPLQLC